MKGSKELIRDTLLKLDGISDNDEWVDLVDRYELDCSPDHLRKNIKKRYNRLNN